MAYDARLADRIRDVVEGEPGLSEKRMFGGLAFLVNGNMAAAASSQGDLMLRVDPERSGALTAEAHVDRVVMRGRAMDGWLRVDPQALDDDGDLRRWVEIGVSYAQSLPPK